MTQIVSSKPYCLESSTQLTRPASETFYRIDGSNTPTIIDKHQAKRLYRLQRAPDRNPGLHVDASDVGYEAQGYFDSVVRKQVNESSSQASQSVYHRPTDMSHSSMTKFSLGKRRLDPQRIVPGEMTTLRDHPSAIKILRCERNEVDRFEVGVFFFLDIRRVRAMRLYRVSPIDWLSIDRFVVDWAREGR